MYRTLLFCFCYCTVLYCTVQYSTVQYSSQISEIVGFGGPFLKLALLLSFYRVRVAAARPLLRAGPHVSEVGRGQLQLQRVHRTRRGGAQPHSQHRVRVWPLEMRREGGSPAGAATAAAAARSIFSCCNCFCYTGDERDRLRLLLDYHQHDYTREEHRRDGHNGFFTRRRHQQRRRLHTRQQGGTDYFFHFYHLDHNNGQKKSPAANYYSQHAKPLLRLRGCWWLRG